MTNKEKSFQLVAKAGFYGSGEVGCEQRFYGKIIHIFGRRSRHVSPAICTDRGLS
jgi:hypothetical protein